MKITNIVFDFGGVLVDWNPKYLYEKIFTDKSELNYFLTEVLPPDWNDRFDMGGSFQENIDELSLKYPKYKYAIQMYKDRWTETIKGEIFINTALLEPLSKKYPLYGLTNWSAETFPIAYERYSFFSIFEGIVVSGVEKVIKPNPDIYKILLSRYNLKPENTIFIDDNINNIKMANNLNINTIHYKNTVNVKDELNKFGVEI